MLPGLLLVFVSTICGHRAPTVARLCCPSSAGGGSVQEAFAMTAEEAKAAPDASYVTQLKGGGRSYSVYVYRCGLVWLSLPESVRVRAWVDG